MRPVGTPTLRRGERNFGADGRFDLSMHHLNDARASRRGRTLRWALAGLIPTLLWLVLAGAASAAAPAVSVYPLPGSKYSLPGSQIVFRGIPASQIGNVSVVGSVTGAHTGHIAADSDGQGGSFLPDKPFAQGETVTVTTGLNVTGATNGSFSFAIAHLAGGIPVGKLPLVKAASGTVQQFASRPDLQPPTVKVLKASEPAGDGDIFVAPQFGPAQNGPMILDPQGHLIWFQPYSPTYTLVTDFRVQQLNGAPVLTWFEGNSNAGYGFGQGIIFNQNYQQIATVHAANGLQMDLHEFLVTPQGDAYIAAASPVTVPGISHPVIDSVVQEIDIQTGLELFEWHALDHVPLSQSQYPVPSFKGHPYDPYHLNSVQPLSNGDLLVSLRNTSGVYRINRSTGALIWSFGGKSSSFKMGTGTTTFAQHDAVMQPDGSLSIFDDGAGPPTVHKYSRGIHVNLDTTHMTATLLSEFDHSPGLSAQYEGSTQLLGDGEVFLGWGQQPYFSEDNSKNQEDFDAEFTSGTSSYRAYRFPWSAQPPTTPVIKVSPNADGSTSIYATWNGATTVSSWQLMAGPSPSALAPLGGPTPKPNFETRISAHDALPYFQVKALGSSGQTLAATPVVATPPHIGIFGGTAFVPSSGLGGLPVSCFSTRECHIATTISAGSTVIARTGREAVGAGSGGVLYFDLTSQGRSMLAHAHHNRLAVTVTTTDISGMSSTTHINLVTFTTSGNGPKRIVHGSPSVHLVGTTEFVASWWVGGVLASCIADTPCLIKTTISDGRTVIATTGHEFLGANELGYMHFTLTAAGHSLLTRAAGNQLTAQITMQSGSDTASGQVALVGFR